MKVVAFNGSPRPHGNTQHMLAALAETLGGHGIDTEIVSLAGQTIRGCSACGVCRQRQDRKCVLPGDPVNDWIEKMAAADGIVLASPTYFADITSELKALIDRAGYVCRGNGDLLARKVGAAVTVMRRAGAIHAFDSINHFFLIQQMVVPGSCYWNLGLGRGEGEVEQDEEGLNTMRVLGENMAWLLQRLHGGNNP